MTLCLGPGPLSPDSDGRRFAGPDGSGESFLQPYPRRVRAFVGDRTVLDSERGRMLHEPGALPSLWFPAGDVDADVVGGRLSDPPTGPADLVAALDGWVSLGTGGADRWFVEDEPVYAHVRDPYHRVDVLSSSRHVLVRSGDVVVAESHRPRLLYETGLPTRYYLPWADVRTDLLVHSDTVSECPYKGDGQHWHVVTGRQDPVADAAWSLPHPLPEGIAATEHVCFYPDKVELVVDGRRVTA